MSEIKSDYDAFIFMKNHLLNQKERCVDDAETCRYRGHLPYTIDIIKSEIDADLFDDDSGDGNALLYEKLQSTPYDAKCAVGALISDTFYSEDLEERSAFDDEEVIGAVWNSHPEWNNFDDISRVMLSIMQKIHDGMRPSEWAGYLDDKKWFFSEDGKFIKTAVSDTFAREANFKMFLDRYVFAE